MQAKISKAGVEAATQHMKDDYRTGQHLLQAARDADRKDRGDDSD